MECLRQPLFELIYQSHFSNSICSFHVSVPHFGYVWQYFRLFHYYVCYGELPSMISDVTTVTVLVRHKLCPYEMVNSTNNCRVCSGCSTAQPFPQLSPSPWASRPPRHNGIEIRPINNPTMASKYSSERKSQLTWQTSLFYFTW